MSIKRTKEKNRKPAKKTEKKRQSSSKIKTGDTKVNLKEKVVKLSDDAQRVFDRLANEVLDKARHSEDMEGRRFGYVRRVNAGSPTDVEELAGGLGYTELAKALTTDKSKFVYPDIEKKDGKTTTDRGLAKKLEEGFCDIFEGPDGDAGLAAYIATRAALDKIEKFEELVANATKEYWRAKRKLLLVTKVLTSAYDDIERDNTSVGSPPSKEEVKNIIQNAISKELFQASQQAAE